MSPLGEHEARLLSAVARHSVTTPCCHRCLGGQSPELVILRTPHSKIPEAHIHLVRKLNSSLRRGRAVSYTVSVALLPVLKLAEGSPAAPSAFAVTPVQVYNYTVLRSTLPALWRFLKLWMLSHGKTYLQNHCHFLHGFPHQNQSLVVPCWKKSLCCSHRL